MNLKYWLPRHKPARLVAVDEEGKHHEILIEEKKSKWMNVIRAIAGVRAVKLIAYNADDKIITSVPLDPEDPTGEDAEDAAKEDAAAAGSPPALIQKMREVDFASVLATGMQIAANIAVDSADRAMQRHEEAYAGRRDDMREAMNQFATVTKMVTDRLVHLEKAWHMLLTDRDTQRGGDDADQLAMTVIDRAFPKHETNGASSSNGEKKKVEPLT
jgi:hypothetical protein